MEEWTDKYNSFNSLKGLLYRKQYEAILAGKFLPPIEVNLDPANVCNLDCVWCNGREVKDRGILMDTGHMLELIQFFREWGVKAVCIAGGGEPTLHPDLSKVLRLCKELKLEVSLMTNGLFRNEEQIRAAAECCEWIAVSIDSGLPGTYNRLKGGDRYFDAKDNMRKIARYGTKQLNYKFLIHPKNQNEIFIAIEDAKEIGCAGIHIRPLSFLNYQDTEDEFDIKAIEAQVEKGRMTFEYDNFKIYYVTHKFNKNLHIVKNFSKCRTTPLVGIFEANGDIVLCIDRKNDPKMIIGQHTDISKIRDIWGSDKHKQVMNDVIVNQCPKCTMSTFQEIYENVIEQDKMSKNFP